MAKGIGDVTLIYGIIFIAMLIFIYAAEHFFGKKGVAVAATLCIGFITFYLMGLCSCIPTIVFAAVLCHFLFND